MKKFELIRIIFDYVIRYGYNDDKQDAISEYTRDKLTHPVYVKKIDINLPNVDSVAITCFESDFSDASDSDVRIAFNNIVGTRVILYANEVEVSILEKIYESICHDINDNKWALSLIREAVELVGDGGCDPFTEEERIIINKFLDKIEKDYGLEYKRIR